MKFAKFSFSIFFQSQNFKKSVFSSRKFAKYRFTQNFLFLFPGPGSEAESQRRSPRPHGPPERQRPQQPRVAGRQEGGQGKLQLQGRKWNPTSRFCRRE